MRRIVYTKDTTASNIYYIFSGTMHRVISEQYHLKITPISIRIISPDWSVRSVGLWCGIAVFSQKATIGGKLEPLAQNSSWSIWIFRATASSVMPTVRKGWIATYTALFIAWLSRSICISSEFFIILWAAIGLSFMVSFTPYHSIISRSVCVRYSGSVSSFQLFSNISFHPSRVSIISNRLLSKSPLVRGSQKIIPSLSFIFSVLCFHIVSCMMTRTSPTSCRVTHVR